MPGAVPALKFPPRDPLGRDNNFNFVRLFLASLVILSHAPELVDGDQHREIYHRIFHHGTFGGLAVNGFFLLSGFLILQSWHREPRMASFVRKRVLRIYPGFVVAYLLSGLVVGPLAAHTQSFLRDINVSGFIFAMLTLRLPTIPEVFAGAPYPVVNGAMWTISHEFRCYLLVPLLGWLGLVKHRVGWLLFTLAVLACAVVPLHFPFAFMTGRLWAYLLPVGPWATLPLLAFFCTGGCFYLFRSELRYHARWAAGLAALLVPCLFDDRSAQLALATAGAYVLFWFAFARIPRLKFFQAHADVSYGVYLYGWPTQSLLMWYFPHASPWVLFAATLGICLGLGFLSWHLVELPFLRLKPRPDPRELGTAPVPG